MAAEGTPPLTPPTAGIRGPRAQPVHPWAWWAWALGLASAVSFTTNPLLIALLCLGLTAVVLTRRTDDPWARSIGAYFALAGVVLVVRLAFQVLVGAGTGSTVLFRLPEVGLPGWAAGIRVGGPVTAEGLAWAAYDALRLGAMLLCLGAANALANPRRALRSVPAALYEASVAVVVALSVAPQLVESTQRVRRARRLRGGSGRGWRAVRAVVLPVLADAIDRSLALAAGMEARGFGRTRAGGVPPRVGWSLVAAMLAVAFGLFWLLADPTRTPWALAFLGAGLGGTGWGLRAAGRGLAVTRHRPDPWTGRDTALAAAGAVAVTAAVALAASGLPGAFAALHPGTDPLTWPTLHPLMAPLVLACVAPLALTTAPSRAAAPRMAGR